jgi:hypothetical protein
MVDLVRVQQQAPKLDIHQLKTHGLTIIYEASQGRLGAADVRQIVNVIVAVHPYSNDLFQVGLTEEDGDETMTDAPAGMTFMVDIPSVRLLPSTSPEIDELLSDQVGAVLDLRHE